MTQMSLAQGTPEGELSASLELHLNFFLVHADTAADPADTDAAYEGRGGWSMHVNALQSRDVSSSWGGWSSRNIVEYPLDDDEE